MTEIKFDVSLISKIRINNRILEYHTEWKDAVKGKVSYWPWLNRPYIVAGFYDFWSNYYSLEEAKKKFIVQYEDDQSTPGTSVDPDRKVLLYQKPCVVVELLHSDQVQKTFDNDMLARGWAEHLVAKSGKTFEIITYG